MPNYALKLEPFADLFWLSALHLRICHSVGLGRRGGNISVYIYICLWLFYFKIQTSWTNLKSTFFQKLKAENNSLTVQIVLQYTKHPPFHSEESLVNLERGRDCFVGLSMLIVYDAGQHGRQMFASQAVKWGLRRNEKNTSVFMDW